MEEENKMIVQDLYSQNVEKIILTRDVESNDIDKIIVVFKFNCIQIVPLVDTDEIDLIVCNLDEIELNGSEDYSFDDYNNSEFCFSWNAINSNGYYDTIILGFNFLHPNLLILSEGSCLKLFDVTARV